MRLYLVLRKERDRDSQGVYRKIGLDLELDDISFRDPAAFS